MSLSYACLLALMGCGGSDLVLPNETGPSAMIASAGNAQSGAVGQALPDSLVATVTDRQGQPVVGVRVAFVPADEGSGTVSPDTTTTNASGHASAQWVLGSKSGAQSVSATIAGIQSSPTATFTATATAGSANAIAMSSGDNQSAPAGTALPAALVVVVIDQFGNPVQGVDVTWSTQNGGSVSPETSTTGADGLASTQRTLGSGAGTQLTTASSSGLNGSPVTFTHTSTSGPASSLQLVSGNSQTGPPGAELPDPLVVRLVDAGGNPIAGNPVSWIIGVGGGSVVPSGNTDADGKASARFTLGPTAGATNTVNAVVSGVGVVGFTATATNGGGGGGGGGGTATTLQIVAGNGQTAEAGTAVPVNPSVKVTSSSGKGVAGFSVTFVVTGGNGTVTGASQTTNSNGVATVGSWVLGNAGTNTLEARATGLNGSPAVFTANATPAPTGLVFRVQPASPQVEDRNFTPAVEVAAVDAGGNVVQISGLRIELSLTPSRGQLRGTTSKSTSNGIAVFNDIRANREGTGYVLTAAAPTRPALGTVTSNSFDVNKK